MSEDALRALHKIATKGRNESARIQASVAILDRAFGRPKVSVDLESDGPMFTAIRQIIVAPEGETIRPAIFGDGTVLDERGRPILDAEDAEVLP
jgi:hypothetical protein